MEEKAHHIVLILGRKSKTAFFVVDSLQGKIKSLVYLEKAKIVLKKYVYRHTSSINKII
jgi:hypothetical protein